jgi:threonine synthase
MTFLAAGGDGFDMLKDCPVLGYLGTLDEILGKHIAELGTITLTEEQRVVEAFPVEETPEATEAVEASEATESEAEDAPATSPETETEAEPEGEAETESPHPPLPKLHKQFDIIGRSATRCGFCVTIIAYRRAKLMMMYQSTRGAAQVSPMQAVYEGMAPDGGLYVPTHLPQLPYGDWAQGTFVQVAQRILSAWLPGFDAAAVLQGAYDAFDTPQVAPLVQVGPAHVLELFHGPTAAFKDVALCVLPRLLKAAGQQLHPGTRLLVLIATSGDTGSAALHGFSGVEGIRALAFYPSKGISAVQRAQMVTMPGGNVAACGIQGNFDDAQSGVKRIFAAPISADVRLSSANSINIGRLVPQITYYYTAYAQLVRQGTIRAGERVDYAVPTGNFGDILAGWLAKHMGLPVGTLDLRHQCQRCAGRVFAHRRIRSAQAACAHAVAVHGYSGVQQLRASAVVCLRWRQRLCIRSDDAAGPRRALCCQRIRA